jgi:plasmid stabilization system protein ParE
MSRLIWSPRALNDLQRLYRFLAKQNQDAAQRAVQTIQNSLNILAQNPLIGRPTVDMEPEYREWLISFGHSGYVALYRVDAHDAVLVAIRHQKEVGYGLN